MSNKIFFKISARCFSCALSFKCTIALLILCLTFTAVSCRSTGDTTENRTNVLVITEIENYSGTVLVSVSSAAAPLGSMIAVGRADVSDNSATVPLVLTEDEEIPWDAAGEYFIILVFTNNNNAVYYYSDGGRSAHKYKFSGSEAIISLGKFNQN